MEIVENRQPGLPHSSLPALKLLAIALVNLIGFILLSGSLKTSTAAAPGAIDPLAPSAYLYCFDPVSGEFVTITLPLRSRPSDVSVVTDTLSDQVWFTEPGLNRIGHLVYTSSVDYALSEYDVPGSPIDVAASATGVWFTLPARDQVGHLDAASGVLSYVDLAPPHAELADIALDADGRAWVTQRAADQIIVSAITPTAIITQYMIPAGGSKPGGLTIDQQGYVWIAATAAGYVWRLNPLDGTFQASPPLGAASQPDRLARETDADHIWAALVNANQLARLATTPLMSISYYTLPMNDSRPGALAIDALDRVYFVQQATNHLGRLVITPTTAFADTALPRADLKLSAIAIGRDNAVWATAFRDIRQLYMPIVQRNYDSSVPPYGAQMYGALAAANGFTGVIESRLSWARFQVLWSSIEPTHTTPENYHWAALDASLRAAADANVQVIVTLENNPAWASPYLNGPVINMVDLQDFVAAIVARYPQVRYWEFYNEPDGQGRFGLQAAAYAAMLDAIYPVVKAANSNAQVVMGGLGLDNFIDEGGPFNRNFLTETLAHCSGTCFDVANFHYYPYYRWRWKPYGRDISGKANYVRQILAAYHFDRPLIASETGWPSLSTWGSSELQARYTVKSMVRGTAAGLSIVIWYAMIDADVGGPGLLAPGLAPRPAYFAMRTFTGLMNPARFKRVIPASELGSANLEGYEFTVPGQSGAKRLDVYWYDCPSMSASAPPDDCDGVAPLAITATRVAKIDKLGNRAIVDDVDDGLHDGVVHLGVLSSPIYIDYEP
jgi:streptogramin lyase